MKPPARVLFIGVDAAEPSLLQAWTAAGFMPNLAALSQDSLQGAIANSPGIYTGSVWPSFHTSLLPGRHGRYFYRQLEPGTYKTAPFPSSRLPVAPFWHQLDRQQHRVAIIDLPKAPLVNLESGIQLSDWGLHDAELLKVLGGDPLRDVYVEIDRGIGRVLSAAGPDVKVIVMASHGMGTHYDGTFMLDEILRRLEGVETDGGKGTLGKLQALWHKMPAGVRAGLMPVSDRFYDAWAGRDRSRRKCFPVPGNDNCACIRINLAGREPDGKVTAGVEYQAFCDSLEADLKEIINVETGQPLVREVLRTEQEFPGERQAVLPDLLIRWNRDAPVRRISSAKIGTISREYHGIRTGDHRNPGRFYARCPGITAGELADPVAVTDFAPTLAALLGVELADVDGKPVSGICDSAG